YTINNMRIGGPYTVTAKIVQKKEKERAEEERRTGGAQQLDFVLSDGAQALQEDTITARVAAPISYTHFRAPRTGRYRPGALLCLKRNKK
ncbi:hypothetical protein, partial [Sphingobacterium daejeonense]|uniref:hypothetical protein n=1 Tax=Sphingobacterium daejeonense TaxID=371142 RepID=UPI003D31CC28